MDPKMPKAAKPKRRKKSQSRTEVTSISDSESDIATKSQSSKPKVQPAATKLVSQTIPTPTIKTPFKPNLVKDSALVEKFTSHYLQRATIEFSEDLDKIREADDFNENALQILVHALKQGTEVWGEEEMRRVVG
ncbi:90e49925-0ac9-4fdf-ab9f-36f4182ad94a [Sclerotinia trifoliorum]|uniref:Ribosome assembly protein 3 n=1 Tax=Sclerotinia trifoliorum TaxID=28548 RepID=A0A8H2VRC4_9HELO|nr:90e49925-0ac9-4fdf-ab9f-36f4182ad94a [Sclerotinia trifoliorum]